jgi:hypothetical protein
MRGRRFNIDISDDTLADLKARLRATRWPTVLNDMNWDDGASLDTIRSLANYWLNTFDWRSQERRLNQLPQFMLEVDGHDIHFIHQKGVGPAPIPLILTHGWPGSFCAMEHILPLLAEPGAHGDDPADAFDVVVPSLPGFGFSARPTKPAMSSKTIATVDGFSNYRRRLAEQARLCPSLRPDLQYRLGSRSRLPAESVRRRSA